MKRPHDTVDAGAFSLRSEDGLRDNVFIFLDPDDGCIKFVVDTGDASDPREWIVFDPTGPITTILGLAGSGTYYADEDTLTLTGGDTFSVMPGGIGFTELADEVKSSYLTRGQALALPFAFV